MERRLTRPRIGSIFPVCRSPSQAPVSVTISPIRDRYVRADPPSTAKLYIQKEQKRRNEMLKYIRIKDYSRSHGSNEHQAMTSRRKSSLHSVHVLLEYNCAMLSPSYVRPSTRLGPPVEQQQEVPMVTAPDNLLSPGRGLLPTAILGRRRSTRNFSIRGSYAELPKLPMLK